MSEEMVNEQGAETTAAPEAPAGGESILDKYTVTEGDAEKAPEDNPATEKSGEEVTLLADKYKTVEELEKGYKEAIKTLTEKGKVAPESYELAEDLGFDPEDPMLGEFSEVAKKHNLSNEAYNDLVKFKAEMDAKMAPNPEAELEKLGPNANELIQGVSKFYQSKLSAEQYESVKAIASTAEGVQILDTLRKSFSETAPVTSRESVTREPSVTQDQAEAKLAESTRLHQEGKFEEAQIIRQEATRMFEKLYAK